MYPARARKTSDSANPIQFWPTIASSLIAGLRKDNPINNMPILVDAVVTHFKRQRNL
jgi:hypothetical protein